MDMRTNQKPLIQNGAVMMHASLAIMQPYFLPYIGYYQMIRAVDTFVIYDNIKYTKKGWINRNRLLLNGADNTFTLPLNNDADSLFVCERELSSEYCPDKLFRKIEGAYAKAPHFDKVSMLVSDIIKYPENNLFRYIFNSLSMICQYLRIETALQISSDVAIDHGLTGQDKVIAICKCLGAETYINAIGGLDLYSRESFAEAGVKLKFIKSKDIQYRQYGQPFVPWLSIIDVMMFNSRDRIRKYLDAYELI